MGIVHPFHHKESAFIITPLSLLRLVDTMVLRLVISYGTDRAYIT